MHTIKYFLVLTLHFQLSIAFYIQRDYIAYKRQFI